MSQFLGQLNPIVRDYLPKVCSQRGCYQDVQQGQSFCVLHAGIRAAKRYCNNHLQAKTKYPKELGFTTNLYAVRMGDFVKFGTAKNIRKRLSGLQVGFPLKLDLLGSVPATANLENAVHLHLEAERARGEWFHWKPRTIAVTLLIQLRDLGGLLELIDSPELAGEVLLSQH